MGKSRAQSQNSNNIVTLDIDSIPSVTNKESTLCQHIIKSVDVNSVKKTLNKNGGFCCLQCSKCNKLLDDCILNICLKCGICGCSTHITNHINTPHSDPHHIVLQLDNIWTVRCYKCKEDIHPDSNNRLKNCLITLKDLRNKNQLKSSPVKRKTDIKADEVIEKMSTEFTLKLTNEDDPLTAAGIPPVRGLTNLGNTCFFNSVLQCLAQTPFLLEVLMEMSKPGETVEINVDDENHLTAKLDKWGQLTETLANTLQEMTNGSPTAYAPSALLDALRRKCRQFIGYNQHDSHELLRQLLDNVRTEDIKRYQYHILEYYGLSNKTIPDEVEENKRALVKRLNQKLTELVVIRPDQVFKGTLVSTVQCMECKHTSEVVENFLDLSLPVFFEKYQSSSSKNKLDFSNKGGPSKSKHQLKKERKSSIKAARRAKRNLQVSTVANAKNNECSHKYKNGKNDSNTNNNNKIVLDGGDERNNFDDKIDESMVPVVKNHSTFELPKNYDSDQQIKLEETTSNELNADDMIAENGLRDDDTSTFAIGGGGFMPMPEITNETDDEEAEAVALSSTTNPMISSSLSFFAPYNRNDADRSMSPTKFNCTSSNNNNNNNNNNNKNNNNSSSSNSSNSSSSSNSNPSGATENISSPMSDRAPAAKSVVMFDADVVNDDHLGTVRQRQQRLCCNNNTNDNNSNHGRIDDNSKDVESDNNSSCSSTEARAGYGAAADNSEIDDDDDSSDADDEQNEDEEPDEDVDNNYFSMAKQNLITLAPRTGFSELESSVHACLSQFTEVEVLSKNNKVICEACTDRQNKDLPSNEKKKPVYQPGTKRLLINSPPPVLILHLKRFQGSGFAAFRKISDHVKFPLHLDIAQYCSVKCQNLKLPAEKKILYSLYGVVEHSGGLYGGHYIAYVKVRPPVSENSYRRSFWSGGNVSAGNKNNKPISSEDIEKELKQTGSWFVISDSSVRPTTVDTVLKSQAYLLFYERLA